MLIVMCQTHLQNKQTWIVTMIKQMMILTVTANNNADTIYKIWSPWFWNHVIKQMILNVTANNNAGTILGPYIKYGVHD